MAVIAGVALRNERDAIVQGFGPFPRCSARQFGLEVEEASTL